MKSISITYKGRGISLNDWYSGSHWSKRKKQKDSMSEEMLTLFNKEGLSKVEWMDQFVVEMDYNSGFDPDNTIPMIKIAMDVLKGKIFKDDSRKYFKGYDTRYNPNLEKYTYVIRVSRWQQEEK